MITISTEQTDKPIGMTAFLTAQTGSPAVKKVTWAAQTGNPAEMTAIPADITTTLAIQAKANLHLRSPIKATAKFTDKHLKATLCRSVKQHAKTQVKTERRPRLQTVQTVTLTKHAETTVHHTKTAVISKTAAIKETKPRKTKNRITLTTPKTAEHRKTKGQITANVLKAAAKRALT